MALALDGTPAQVIGTTGSSPTVGTISTTFGYGKVFIFALANFAGTNSDAITSITGGGLTFTRHARASVTSDTHYWGELWSADIGATPLSSVTFTVNFSASTQYCTLSAFAVSNGGNANGLSFDSGGPQTASAALAADPGAQASMTTATAAALVIGCSRTNNEGTGTGVTAGWAGIMSGVANSYSQTGYRVESSTGTFTQTTSTGGQLVSIITAVYATPGGGGGVTLSQLERGVRGLGRGILTGVN